MTSSSITQDINEVQLCDVYLAGVSMRNRQETEPIPPGTELRWHLDTRVAYRMRGPAELSIKLRAEIQYDEGSPRPFDLVLEVVGVYRSEGPIAEDRIPSLIVSHSQPLLWPYLREVVSDFTTRAGGPTLVLPTLKINIPGPAKKSRRPRSQGYQPDSPTET